MAIQELALFPRRSWSAAQGFVGTRKWVLTKDEDVDDFIGKLCDPETGHWPGDPNSVPILIQEGALDDKIDIRGGSPFGKLPRYNATLVVAQYQFLLWVLT